MSIAPARSKRAAQNRKKERTPYGGSRLLVIVLILAAFGPYVVGPLRTEQIVVYGLAPLLVFTFIRLKSWSAGLLAAWLSSIVVVTISHAFRYPGAAPAGPGSALAGYDGLFLPLVVMTLIWTLVPLAGSEAVLKTAARWIVVLSALNSVFAVASSVVPSVASALTPFWGAGDGESVADRAMTMGRFSGIFNQPAEAGLVYSIAAVLAVWAFAHRTGLMYLLLAIIIVGGMLSVSKVFLLVGLPIAILLLLKTHKMSGWVGVFMLAVILLLVLSTARFFQEWTGLDYLTRLLEVPADQTVLQFYTAGRWTEGSSVVRVAEFILGASPLIGMGIAGLRVPYDSMWTEAIVMGGLIIMMLMAMVLIVLVRAFKKIPDKRLRLTSYAFWLVLVGSSFGIPSLTVNRAATIVWVVAALLVAVSANAREPGGNEGPEGIRSRKLKPMALPRSR